MSLAANIEAALIDRGNGLIYDPDLDITWLADANYAMTSGYDDDGRMDWSATQIWVQQLSYLSFTNWRLPSTLDPDPNCVEMESIKGSYLYYCSGSEMGHLFYTELGSTPVISTNSAVYGSDLALFSNLQRYNYWSATETIPGDTFPSCTSDCAWDFDFKNGVQTGYPKNYSFYALAIHTGDIGGESDTDGDGIPDITDTDDDNDGIPDWVEIKYELNPLEFDALKDNDADGYGNLLEYLTGTQPDNNHSVPVLTITPDPDNPAKYFDTDKDGITNDVDIDDDGDGYEDTLDYYPLDVNEWFDVDGDTVGDNSDLFPNDPSEWLDSDLDGIGNNEDTDDDNDGTPDTKDAYPYDASRSQFESNNGGTISVWWLLMLLIFGYWRNQHHA